MAGTALNFLIDDKFAMESKERFERDMSDKE